MMTIATSGKLTFEQFLEQYPDDRGRYELVDGEIVEMRSIRWHDDIDETGVYQSTAFKEDDQIISQTFPELELTMNQILEA